MSIPKQVQKQSEEVQELYKQINGEPEEAQADAEATPVEAVNDVAEPTTSDSVEEQAPQSEPQEQVESGDQEPKQDDWQQKYRSLQGMYNADVPRLNAENRDLSSRVSQLEGLLSSMQEPAQQTPAVAEKLITDDDVKEYGDSIAVMRKAAREEVAQEIAQLRQQVGQLQGVLPQVQQVQAQQKKSGEQTFWNTIANEVPNWNDINNDPDFQSWLLAVDPLTGINRQTYLEDAQKQLDANRVVSFLELGKGRLVRLILLKLTVVLNSLSYRNKLPRAEAETTEQNLLDRLEHILRKTSRIFMLMLERVNLRAGMMSVVESNVTFLQHSKKVA